MKHFLLLVVAVVALFAASAAPASAQAVDDCSIAYHEPITDGSFHIALAHAVCATDSTTTRSRYVGVCLQQAFKATSPANPFGNVVCGGRTVYYDIDNPADELITVPIRCTQIQPVRPLPPGDNLFRSATGAQGVLLPGTQSSAPVPLACPF